MNRKGILIGKILTNFPSLIFVFVILLIFVIVSGFISVGSRFSEDLMGDFTNNYIILNDEVVTVNEAIEMFCNDKNIEDSLKVALRENFLEEYGEGNAFAFIRLYAGGLKYELYSWYGFSSDGKEDEIGEYISLENFKKVFGEKEKNVKYASVCTWSGLYVKSGGVNE